MPVANPKTRLISFRVSEHEYARLRTLSNAQGAHSLADFVRTSVCWIMECVPPGLGSVAHAGGPAGSFSHLNYPPALAGMVADQTSLSPEVLSGQVLALQLRVELLDREVRRLGTILGAADPAVPGGPRDDRP
jgi:hypothetical protein